MSLTALRETDAHEDLGWVGASENHGAESRVVSKRSGSPAEITISAAY